MNVFGNKGLTVLGKRAALLLALLTPGLASAIPYDMAITGAGLNLSYTDLRIGGDEWDYYETAAITDGLVVVDIFFSDSAADLDLRIFDAAFATLAAAYSTSDNEQVSASFSAGDMFFVGVNVFGGTLAGVVDTDRFDPNDLAGTASVLGASDLPVPATLALFGLGLAGLAWTRRKKA